MDVGVHGLHKVIVLVQIGIRPVIGGGKSLDVGLGEYVGDVSLGG